MARDNSCKSGEGEMMVKKVKIICGVVLLITVLILGVNVFVSPLSAWAVRLNGIVAIIDVLVFAYATSELEKR